MLRRGKTCLVILFVAAFVAVATWSDFERRRIDAVYAVCENCGLSRNEIDKLIESARDAKADRTTLLEAFYATFERREDAESCLQCAEAVLAAAGRLGLNKHPGRVQRT